MILTLVKSKTDSEMVEIRGNIRGLKDREILWAVCHCDAFSDDGEIYSAIEAEQEVRVKLVTLED